MILALYGYPSRNFGRDLWLWYYDADMKLRVWDSETEEDRSSYNNTLTQIRQIGSFDELNEILYDSGDL